MLQKITKESSLGTICIVISLIYSNLQAHSCVLLISKGLNHFSFNLYCDNVYIDNNVRSRRTVSDTTDSCYTISNEETFPQYSKRYYYKR